ncbi:MAG: hypothetical protein RBR81_01285 [Bacteroidales bacterium]|nr:hypothetical protein [Bacteroidales bacterium]
MRYFNTLVKVLARLHFAFMLAFTITTCSSLFSQEAGSGSFDAGADLYSSFIWRGTKNGSGPAVQPVIEYTRGCFTAGAWGSFDLRGYEEVDLYATWMFPGGFSIGIIDYYSPDLRYFDYSRESGSHAFEINLGFSSDKLSLEADYVLNEAAGIGSSGGDLYFQAGYSFSLFSLFLGAGNGWLTWDQETDESKFSICNLGLEISKVIVITDAFEIPVTGQLILNPDRECLFLVVGFTF